MLFTKRAPAKRSARRRHAPIGLEALEGRELKTVANYYGTLLIEAGQAGAQTSVQTIDNGNTLEVVSEGQAYDFAASTVTSINYLGSQGGGDTFTNQTDRTTLVMTYDGNNTITAGTGFTLAFLEGDNNTYDGGSSPSLVYTDGSNDTVTGSDVDEISYPDRASNPYDIAY